WQVGTELSYTDSSGNSESQTLAGKIGIKKEEELNRYYFNGTVIKTESENEETANRWGVDGSYERTLGDGFFGSGEAYYLKDKFSGYKYRYGFGPGVGYDFIKIDSHYLKGVLSILYSYDRYSEGLEDSDQYLSGKTGIQYEWKLMENLTFKENAYYQTSLKDADLFFLYSETSLKVKVNSMISLGLRYVINYQNEPASPEIEKTDRIFFTSVIIDF
ncbi:MAG: DUF481 domain-containing protein, partial [Syntrophales bacterium]|nr:DUF481 domain-containing protein [Syntrophales bacterium]